MATIRLQVPQTGDTSSAVADSLGSSLDRLGEGVANTGRLILSGDWDAVLARAVEGGAELLASFIPSFLSALLVGLVFFAAYRILMRIAHGLLRKSRRVGKGLEAMAVKTLRIVGWSFIALLVLAQLGVNISALIAGLGIAGLAVGFAAKDSLENFISGVTILLDRPFRIGDWVEVGERYGEITEITLRSTRLRTLNDETVVLPNVKMVNQPLVNHTTGDPLRVDVPFGIAYKEDIDQARAAVMELVDQEDDRLAPDRPHRVVTTELGDSSVGMELHLFVRDPGNAVALRFELTEAVKKALDRAGIEIPFPHLQLFVDEAEGLRDLPFLVVTEGAS